MSLSNQNEKYWDLVEDFIQQANNKLSDADLGLVSSALLEASARFGAFYVASSSEDRNELKEDRDSTITDFGGEYKKRLADNLDDYIENYKVYMREE